MSMANANINFRVEITWAYKAALFTCRYIKKKWALKLLAGMTMARFYAGGRLVRSMKLKDCDEF